MKLTELDKNYLIREADEPDANKSARAKLDLNLRDRGHSVEKPKKGKGSYQRTPKHKNDFKEAELSEGPLVLTRDSDLRNMLDTLLKGWLSQGSHSDEEYRELLKALGYRIERDGQRSVITKENFEIDEAPGDIRKGMAAIAMIAALWGVNKNLAQDAYDASPQLQKLTAYLEVAKDHNDQRMIDQLESRIEAHKLRIDLGKGEVMGKDGNPIDVKYDKAAKESTDIPFDQCPKCGDAIFHEAEGKKDACYHKVKSRYKVWPSAYASGALVQCRKKGAKNWGNSKK